MPEGLIVVGTGIQAAGQFTIEARNAICGADTVFYLVADPVTLAYITELNPNLRSLHDCYADGKPRMQSYLEMVARVIDEVERGRLVCLALYGHPGVFAYPSHEAIRRLRERGIYARMVPGVSAEDCLFADLGIDPAWSGCQSFETTDFLLSRRIFDPRSYLVLWQVGVIGDASFQSLGYDYRAGLAVLVERLREFYEPGHRTIVYEASHHPIYPCRRDTVELGRLAQAQLTAESTLVVTPLPTAKPDEHMLARLGMQPADLTQIAVRLNLAPA